MESLRETKTKKIDKIYICIYIYIYIYRERERERERENERERERLILFNIISSISVFCFKNVSFRKGYTSTYNYI